MWDSFTIPPLYTLHYFVTQAADFNNHDGYPESGHIPAPNMRCFQVVMRAASLRCVAVGISYVLDAYDRVVLVPVAILCQTMLSVDAH